MSKPSRSNRVKTAAPAPDLTELARIEVEQGMGRAPVELLLISATVSLPPR